MTKLSLEIAWPFKYLFLMHLNYYKKRKKKKRSYPKNILDISVLFIKEGAKLGYSEDMTLNKEKNFI